MMNEAYEGRVKELALAMHEATKKFKPALPEVRDALEMLYGVSLGMERNINGDVEFAIAGIEAATHRWKKYYLGGVTQKIEGGTRNPNLPDDGVKGGTDLPNGGVEVK